jgi:hypothetical protein
MGKDMDLLHFHVSDAIGREPQWKFERRTIVQAVTKVTKDFLLGWFNIGKRIIIENKATIIAVEY